MSLEVKQKLESLCCSNGWSYGVFWGFDERNPVLLTLNDAYYEEQMREVVDNMLLQVQMLGEGIIGQTVLTGKHKWLFSDTTQDMIQDVSEFRHQFMSGIKTILVIPVGARGVVQFGSVQKVPERPEFSSETKKLLQYMDYVDGHTSLGSTPSSLASDLNELFASLLQSESSLEPVHSCRPSDMMEHPCSTVSSSRSSFEDDNFMVNALNSYTVDELSLLFTQSPSKSMVTTTNNDNAQLIQEWSVLSGLPGANASVDCDLFDVLGVSFGCSQMVDSQKDASLSAVSSVLQDRTELDAGKRSGTRKGLFSELGLDELLSTVCSNASFVPKSGSEDHFPSTKRRKTESSVPVCDDTVSMNLTQHIYGWGKTSNTSFEKEVSPNEQVGLWTDDCYSIGDGSTVVALSSKKPKEYAKVTKKRAKPGEGTRPRPKDRQLIQERIKELRGIIPNGAKCSIDALLDLTTKHMLFLQCVAKYVDTIKQCDKPKLIDQQNGLPPKERVGEANGTTWAYEVGDQTMFCPIIVEDLTLPGHMLIEMLCEEQGYFLEIVDMIKGIGLSVLRGVMETRGSNLWARFIVEANRNITRLDVFWSLAQLLHQIDSTSISSTNETANFQNDAMIPRLNDHQQTSIFPLPVTLLETFQ